MKRGVPPAVLDSKNVAFPYRVPLCDRCAEVNGPSISSGSHATLNRRIYGCTDEEGKGLVTINNPFLVTVKELVYPGEAADVQDVENKWLYVFKDDKVVAEVQAVKKGQWKGHTWIGGKKKRVVPSAARAAGQLELDPGPKGKRSSYRFLLSPVKLTPKSIGFLLSDKNRRVYLNEVVCNAWNQEVRVSDPFRWAVDTHVQYLAPNIEGCLEYQTDEERAAKLFIASTLKAWMGNGDPANIENELQEGQPDKFLEDYKRELNEGWLEAEKAAAYLAHCVESREFFAINQACMETGGQDLSTAYQMWSLITDTIDQTKSGRVLLRRILADKESLPSKYLFHPPDRKPGNQLQFSQCRWGYLAAAATYENLLPTLIDSLAITPRDVQKYLENISLKSELKGTHKTIHDNLHRGRSITAGVKSKAARNRVRRSFDKLEGKLGNNVPSAYNRAIESADKVYKDYEPVFKSVKFSVGTLFEIANFTLAVAEYCREENITSAEEFYRKISVVGAASDLGAHVLDCMGELIKRQALKRTIQGTAAAVSIVASVCDMVEFERGALDAAFGEYDYGKAFGYGVQTLGAGCAVYAASTVLASGLGLSVPTAGFSLILAVIGAALIFGGSLLAAWLSKNAHQKFAQFCFLGEDWDAITDKEQLWSEKIIPTRSIMDEVKNLLALLSQFTMERFGSSWLIIRPGYLENGSVFEIRVTEMAGNLNNHPEKYTVQVFMDNDEILVTDGSYELKKESYVRRNYDGIVESIYVNLEKDNPDPLERYGSITVLVKLFINNEIKVPKIKWTQYEVLPSRDLLSILSSSEKVSSLNVEHWMPK